MRTVTTALSFLLAAALPAMGAGQTLLVEPYLQTATPRGIWVMWESDEGDTSVVEWGPDESLGELTTTPSREGLAGTRMHEVELTGLEPDTVYHYRISTAEGAIVSATHAFRTPPEASAEAPLRLVAMSDMQRDGRHPEIWGQIVEDGVLGWVDEQLGVPAYDALSMVLIPGDLVDDGVEHEQWVEQFFAPAASLFSQVPVYPVLGNHEANANLFFEYFHLPPVGNPLQDEHWWTIDYSNVRVVGLDSNGVYALPPQLGYLEGVLEESCDAEEIDFVFAQLHHPYLSELWTPGQSNFTGEVIRLLEEFTDECGKPSVHFFGHTHGYSRGQSRDHQHLWVNVASAGGALDRWGEQPQRDYEEFVVSQDEYGFVVVEVSAGDDPTLSLRRVSRGDPEEPLDNVVSDEMVVRRYNRPPRRPAARATVIAEADAECIWVAGTTFRDPDGDELGAAHWQIARQCDPFDDLVYDEWRQQENWYDGRDTRAGLSLDDERVSRLDAGEYCWRVRYRDASLAWSPWSEPAPLTVGEASYDDNLLQNPGAEEGADGWDVVEPELEALSEGECGGVAPRTGERYFVVGGLCEPTEYGEARQRVDLSPHAEAIDGGGWQLRYGGWAQIDLGGDQPLLWLELFDGDDERLVGTQPLIGTRASWVRLEEVVAIPVGTRRVDFVIAGRRRHGDDNNAYFDDLFLGLEDASDCAAPPVDPDEPPPEDLGGEDMGPRDAGGTDAEDGGGGDLEPDMGDDAAEAEAEADLGFDVGVGEVGEDSGSQAGADSSGDDEGCGCALGGQRGPGSGTWLLLVGVAGELGRRRRRRRGTTGGTEAQRDGNHERHGGTESL